MKKYSSHLLMSLLISLLPMALAHAQGWNIRLVGSIDSINAQSVSVSGNYAYVLADACLRVIDVSDPTNPAEVGFCQIIGGYFSVAFAGDWENNKIVKSILNR